MRIAVLLSGQTRTWRRCVASHLSLFPGHDVDFYLQAWTPAPHAELSAAYKPVVCHVEVPTEISKIKTERMVKAKGFYLGPKNHERACALLHQWRAIRTIWEFASKGNYEAFVRLRYDLLFREPLPGLLRKLGAADCRVPVWINNLNGYNDHLAVLGPVAAEVYCNMTAFHRERLGQTRDKEKPFHFTRNLKELLDSGGVEVEQVAVPYLLVRPEFAAIQDYDDMYAEIFKRDEGGGFRNLVRRNHPD